jgi:isoleucyl-tRNA synthetase
VRSEVLKALEIARSGKHIGHSLDAAVSIRAGSDVFETLYPYKDDLKTLFIVSSTGLEEADGIESDYESTEVKGLSIGVESAAGKKCQRCWMHDASVGAASEPPDICDRCRRVLAVTVEAS